MGRGKHLNGKVERGGKILTREEVLRILSEQARKGSVTAAVNLERALRLGDVADADDEDDIWAELDALRPTRQRDPHRRPDDPSDN